MKSILNQLFEHKTLTASEARAVLQNMAMGTYNDAEIASFITVYLMRSITEEELGGFRDALLNMAIQVDLGESDFIDVCGTGGDGKNTFNISTLSAFVVAGAGYKVAKHGNYGVSSVSGSSNVLESLGYTFTRDEQALRYQLQETNICFMHAPLFHPALKAVGGIRKDLGVKTFFNMLGPLVNPARPKKQLAGVFNLPLQRLYAALMQKSHRSFCVLHDLNGFDEISLTGKVKYITEKGIYLTHASELGFEAVNVSEIDGGTTVEDGRQIFLDIISGKEIGVKRNVVLANAALAIQTADGELTYDMAFHKADHSLKGSCI
ncbi:MAG: anthranilate phosphoribosyltransferase [Saprospiraceae bacterium]|nr:anthranilate phosphoribosyltransferase [Saprospiraceae bacterium]